MTKMQPTIDLFVAKTVEAEASKSNASSMLGGLGLPGF
jgi:hypothetical protein